MPRPAGTDEITERQVSLGRFHTELFGTHPSVLKAYAALLGAVSKIGGHAEQRYSEVEVLLPKGAKELTEALETAQRRWGDAESSKALRSTTVAPPLVAEAEGSSNPPR